MASIGKINWSQKDTEEHEKQKILFAPDEHFCGHLPPLARITSP
jgi:hypothetical protein